MKHTLLKSTAAFLSLLGFFAFIAPLFTGSLNLGGMTGLFLSALLLCYAVFFEKCNAALKKLCQKRVGRAVLSLVLASAIAALALAAVFTVQMVQSATKEPAENATVIVLGCRVRGEKASLMLYERIVAAYNYLNEHPGAVAVLSGGQGEDEDISEALCMFRYLTEKGIDPARLYLEEKSTSTRENILFSHDIIVREDLNPALAIATNEFHCHRALTVARELGYEAAAVPARTAAYLIPTYYLRELWGILYESLF